MALTPNWISRDFSGAACPKMVNVVAIGRLDFGEENFYAGKRTHGRLLLTGIGGCARVRRRGCGLGRCGRRYDLGQCTCLRITLVPAAAGG